MLSMTKTMPMAGGRGKYIVMGKVDGDDDQKDCDNIGEADGDAHHDTDDDWCLILKDWQMTDVD